MSCFFPRSVFVRNVRVFYRDTVTGKYNYRFENHSYNTPCGKCQGCLRDRQNSFAFRLLCESKIHKYAYFVTLTYSDKYLPSDFCLHQEQFQAYIKKLKDITPLKSYYLCGEYGAKRMRPHAHCILFYDVPQNCDFAYDRKTCQIDESKSPSPFSRCWSVSHKGTSKYDSLGRCDIKPFTTARAGYVCKYSVKQLGLNYNGLTPPFALFSKGIGLKGFLNSSIARQCKFNASGIVYFDRYFVKLPRFFKLKLFDYGSELWYKVSNNASLRARSFEDSQKLLFGDSYYSGFYSREYNRYDSFCNSILSKNLTNFYYAKTDQ